MKNPFKNVPWKKIGIGIVKGFGMAELLKPFVPKKVADWIEALGDIVETIELNKEGATGPEKKAALVAIAKTTIEQVEALYGKDLVTDSRVLALVGDICEDEVELRNVAARLQQRREDLQALVDDIKALRKPK